MDPQAPAPHEDRTSAHTTAQASSLPGPGVYAPSGPVVLEPSKPTVNDPAESDQVSESLQSPEANTSSVELQGPVTAGDRVENLNLESSVGEKGFQLFKSALNTACKFSDSFPPLKTALTGVITIVDFIDVS